MSSFVLICCLLSTLVHAIYVPSTFFGVYQISLWLSVTLNFALYMVNHIQARKKSRMLSDRSHASHQKEGACFSIATVVERFLVVFICTDG